MYPDQIVLADPSPIPALDMQSFIGLIALLTTTIINVIGVRLLATINNIGVGAEILGMLVFALVLLFFANHQSPSILFDTSYTTNLADGSYPAVFLVGMFMALFVVYGFDTAGTFGEETLDARVARRPAASCPRSGCPVWSAPSSCSPSPCPSRTWPPQWRPARRSASRSPTRSSRT
jgi:hypothetical protein